jgi:transcriptional regulator with XRE-family HTH domain
MVGRKLHASKIRDMRTDRGWSQEHLAAAAELTPRTVQRVEAGERVSPNTRMAIAAAFQVSPESLVASGNRAGVGRVNDSAEPQTSSGSALKR